jgi:hypothetical protein
MADDFAGWIDVFEARAALALWDMFRAVVDFNR